VITAGALLAASALLCLFQAGVSQAATAPLLQIGGTGTEAGQIDNPASVAVAPNGDVYVGESSNHRISQFSGAGTFIRAWGIDVVPGNADTGFEACAAATGCKAGLTTGGSASIAGATFDSQGFAIAANGDVFSIDNFNGRINHYTASGGFVNAFGLDVVPANAETGPEVCTAVTGCKQGVFGSGSGTLGDGFELAIGPANQLYVIHANLRRVTEYTTAGQFVKSWGFDVIPGGAAALEACTIVTACQSGTSGGGAGQLNGPRGIGVANGGDILVANNGRVDEYTPAGEFVRAWGFDVDPAGSTGFEVCTIASGCKAPVTGAAAGQLHGGINGIAMADDGTTYVADTLGSRVMAFAPSLAFEFGFGFDVDPAGGAGFESCLVITTCKKGVAGTAFGQLDGPKDLAVDCRGGLWVTDTTGDRVTRFGEPGTPSCVPAPPGPVVTPSPPSSTAIAKPSNAFTVAKAKLNRKKGTATLRVSVPGPGQVAIAGKRILAATKAAPAAGDVVLPVVLGRKKAKVVLAKGARATVTVTVSFTPSGGEQSTQTLQMTLKRDPARI
jgi:hypothetical protein